MFVVCEKWVETRTDCYIDPSSSLDHSSYSFVSWLGLLNRGSLRAQSPLSGAGSPFGILSPTVSNHPGTWLYYFQTSTCFHCSSTYLHWCISWLTARSRVNIYHLVIVMSHSFFTSIARFEYFSIFSFFLLFTLWSAGTAKSTTLQILFFLLINIRYSLLANMRWSVCISKSKWILWGQIFLDRFWFVQIPFVSMVKLSTLAQFPVSYSVLPTFLFYSHLHSLTWVTI